jgi:TldD protein
MLIEKGGNIMRELLRAALRLAEADYCEIRFEESNYLNIIFRGCEVEKILKEIQYGGNVRALHKGAWGFASFNNPDQLFDMVQVACRQAKLAGERQKGESKLATVPVLEDEFTPEYTLNPGAISLEEKVRILTRYKDLILNFDPAITAASIIYKETHTDLYFANTDGAYIKQKKLDIGANIDAIACRGDITVTKRIGLGSSSGFDCMLNIDDELREACDLAVRLLDAPQVKAGVYTVICDQDLSGLFVHEAFGHLSEADDTYKKPSMAKTMTLGRQLGKDFLNIYDTGEYFEHRGAIQYDDEGVAAEWTDLIKNGILVGRLHSRETAGMMGEKPTGSARALNYTFPPICRMRSTCIAPGESSFSDMIKDVQLGVYALGSGGGETNGEMFTFNASHGYMIRNGQIAELVKDVKLMGNVFTTLENIDMIGREATGRGGSGGCGKNDQMPLPVSGICPHIRIQNVIVGGAK